MVRPTPLEYSRALSAKVGADVYLKCENLQRAGSFKIRGAYTRMARLSAEEKAARRRRGERREPRPGRRARGPAARHPLDGLHAARRPDAEDRRRPRPTARRSSSSGMTVDDCLRRGPRVRGRARARCSSTRSTTRTSSPGRAPAAWRSSSSARGAHRRRQRGRGWAARRDRDGGAGAAPGRAGGGRAGRGGRRIPAVAGGRPARARCERMSTMADGIAVGRPGRRAVRASSSELVDEVAHGARGRAVPRAAAPAWSGRSWSSSRPARPPSRA